MQAAQGAAFGGKGVIVLYEVDVDTGGGEVAVTGGLGEKAAFIAVFLRVNQLDGGDGE